jgi:hypothetical protein
VLLLAQKELQEEVLVSATSRRLILKLMLVTPVTDQTLTPDESIIPKDDEEIAELDHKDESAGVVASSSAGPYS